MEVQATDVIEVYKQKLSDANHEIAILTAQLSKLQRQEAPADVHTAGRNQLDGRQSS